MIGQRDTIVEIQDGLAALCLAPGRRCRSCVEQGRCGAGNRIWMALPLAAEVGQQVAVDIDDWERSASAAWIHSLPLLCALIGAFAAPLGLEFRDADLLGAVIGLAAGSLLGRGLARAIRHRGHPR